MPDVRLSNFGFYVLLLFAFFAGAWPKISYFFAGALLILWIIDIVISRETEVPRTRLFYPILALNIFLILAGLVAAFNGEIFRYTYVGLLMLFYFIVPGFVISGERRKMVVWSFIAGVILASGYFLISWWDNAHGIHLETNWPGNLLSFEVALVICMLLSFYAEARDLREKLFYFFVALIPILTAAMALDYAVILALLAGIVLVAIFKDRLILIPTAIIIAILFSGIFGISYDIEKKITPASFLAFTAAPAAEIEHYRQDVANPQFYGITTRDNYDGSDSERPESFFMKLFRYAGPAALMLLFWIVIEQARESYSRRRRAFSLEAKSHHFSVLLILLAVIIMNLYSSAFDHGTSILVSWMVLGMTEI